MDFKRLTKITIYSFLINVFAIFGIIFLILTIPTWSEYGFSFLKYNHKLDNIMPGSVQIYRGAAYMSLILYLTFSVLSINHIKNIDNKNTQKILFYSGGFFINFFLPYIIYVSAKNNYYKEFFKYLNQKGMNENGIYKNKKFYEYRKNILYKIFTIICFSITIIALLIILIPMFTGDRRFDNNNVRSNFFFGTITFFTTQTNFLTFLFMFFFVFFGNRVFFEDNKALIHVASYIFFVLLIFWLFIFPKSIDGIMISYPEPFDIFKTTWHHGINPLIFSIFAVWTIKVTRRTPLKFNKLLMSHLAYPFVYGVYIYALPFFTQTSIYGSVTNINPNSVTYYDFWFNQDVESGLYTPSSGSWENIFIVIPIAILFSLILFLFWYSSILLSDNKIKKFIK